MERDLEVVLAERREAQKTHFASFTMFLGLGKKELKRKFGFIFSIDTLNVLT